MPGPYETLASTYIWQSKWYNVRQDHIRTPDGAEGHYTLIEHPGAVWIIPITPDGHIVLEWQYRYTIDEWCWELPAGGILPGSSPETMARQELAEEIGGTAERWENKGWFYTMNGIGTEIAHIFMAWGVRLGPPKREPTEIMELYSLPIERVLRMAHDGEITDGPSALALLLCEPHLLGFLEPQSIDAIKKAF